mgnify:CR=1 FL=1
MNGPNLLKPKELVQFPACLGLCLGAREVGQAAATVNELLSESVLNIRKIASDTGKERRFRQTVERAITQLGVERIAVVRPVGEVARHVVVKAQELVLDEVADRTGVIVTYRDADDVRKAHLTDHSLRPSNQRLARELVKRYPELEARLSEGTRARTGKERYWSRMFLALGAALIELRAIIRNPSIYGTFATNPGAPAPDRSRHQNLDGPGAAAAPLYRPVDPSALSQREGRPGTSSAAR